MTEFITRNCIGLGLPTRAVVTIVVLYAVLALQSAAAQTLPEYIDAAKNADRCTCDNIPNSSYRSECKSKSAVVEDKCKTEKWSCQWAKLETKALKEKIASMDQKIRELKEEKDKLAKSTASDKDQKVKDLENQINKMSGERDFSDKSLATDRNDADKRIAWGQECYSAREAVQEVFKKALIDAKAVSDRDPAIKPYAEKLIQKWNACAAEHQQALRDVLAGIDYCKACRDGTK